MKFENANYRDGQNRINGGYIGFMAKIEIIVEMAKIEINRRPYWIYCILNY